MATPPVFTAGQILTAAQMNQVGLWLIQSKTLSSATGVTFDNVFTSDFRNYRVTYSYTVTSGTTNAVRMRVGGVTTSGGTAYRWSRSFITGTSAPANNGGSTGAANGVFANVSATGINSGAWDVYQPALATLTNWTSLSVYTGFGEWSFISHDVATAYDGFEVSGGTNMTGVISVYGYRA
jgi:hypothetical protein